MVCWTALGTMLLLLTATPGAAQTKAAGGKLTLVELRKQRKEMAQRRRRIVFNNDGDDLAGFSDDHLTETTKKTKAMAATPEGLLKLRTTGLLGSQVDSIFYHSALGLKLHHGGGPYEEIYAAPDLKGDSLRNRINLLVNYGKDALDVMVDFCRKNDLEIFYSNRMNDMHDYYIPGILYYLRVKHPEYTIGHSGRSPEETLKLLLQTRKVYSGYNYALEEIRNLTVEAMREVCRTYDIDGIELDYFRSPLLFPWPVDQRETDLLNDMMRKMRKMTEEEGLRRGRPILIAARYIEDVKYSLRHGLDVKTWLEEDLVDVLTGAHAGEQRFSHKPLFALAHRYNVPCYPVVGSNHKDGSRSWQKRDWTVWRAEAMARFAEGADGITTFNMFDPTEPLWWELGDLQKMLSMDNTYVWDCLPSARYKRNRPSVTVTPKGCEPIPLHLGEDFTAAAPAGTRRSLKLRIHQTWVEKDPAALTDPTPKHDLVIKVNGRTLPDVRVLPAVRDHRGTLSVVPILPEWQFMTDPKDLGVKSKWYKNDFDDAAWAAVRSDSGKGWDSEGFGGYTGYGWYRAQLPPMPEQLRKFAYVHFGAVDEQAWVYLNGKLIMEHTTKTTGLVVHQLWLEPFGVDVSNQLRKDGPNVLAVRVHNSAAMGGIWKPVHLVLSDTALDKKGQKDAVAQLMPGPQAAWLELVPEPQFFKLGENLIEAQVKRPPTGAVTIDQVRLHVRYVQ